MRTRWTHTHTHKHPHIYTRVRAYALDNERESRGREGIWLSHNGRSDIFKAPAKFGPGVPRISLHYLILSDRRLGPGSLAPGLALSHVTSRGEFLYRGRSRAGEESSLGARKAALVCGMKMRDRTKIDLFIYGRRRGWVASCGVRPVLIL